MTTGGGRRVVVARIGRVRHVRLADGARNNALGPDLVADLRQALAEDGSAGAILISAEGRNFCAGGDHAELAALDTDGFRRYLGELTGLFSDVAASPVPVVAAVQRAVVGGGLELALLADLVVASHDAWFQLPQIELGGRVGLHSYRNLLARSGLSVTRRLALLGERFDATAALRHGLVDDVVERPRLDETGAALATRLAETPPRSMSQARADLSSLLGAAEALRATTKPRPHGDSARQCHQQGHDTP